MKLATRLRRGRRRARLQHLARVMAERGSRLTAREMQLEFFGTIAEVLEQCLRRRGPNGNDRLGRYILIDGEPYRINESEGLGWAAWMEVSEDQRVLKQTPSRDTKLLVSTVFLGVCMNFFNNDGPPLLWETMIFGDTENTDWHGFQRRYTSREAALAEHDEIVDQVQNGIILTLDEELESRPR